MLTLRGGVILCKGEDARLSEKDQICTLRGIAGSFRVEAEKVVLQVKPTHLF